jgi:ankyrin repeat protein
VRCLVLAAILLAASAVGAQTPPSPAETAAYDGLHAAAHADDAAAVQRLASAGADVDARDVAGRTPAHVAAFPRAMRP